MLGFISLLAPDVSGYQTGLKTSRVSRLDGFGAGRRLDKDLVAWTTDRAREMAGEEAGGMAERQHRTFLFPWRRRVIRWETLALSGGEGLRLSSVGGWGKAFVSARLSHRT